MPGSGSAPGTRLPRFKAVAISALGLPRRQHLAKERAVEIVARVKINDRGVEEAFGVEIEAGNDAALQREFGIANVRNGDALARRRLDASRLPLVGVAAGHGAAEIEDAAQPFGQEVEGEG